MNRLLGGTGLVDRAAVLRLSGRRNARLTHPLRIDPRSYRVLDPTSSFCVLPRHSFNRLYATNPPPTADVSKSIDQPPPSTAAQKSKSKVELRPGPAKPTTPTSVPSSPKVQAANKVAKVGKPPNQELDKPRKPPPEPAEDEKSIILTAKRDMEKAAQHGVLAPPPENFGIIRKLFHQAKELFKFYFGGIKRIFAHRRDVRKIHERVKAGGAPLSRSEYRFIRTHSSDMIKLVPFVLLLLVLEEVIPLIVIYAPGFLPSTCVLPSQRERIERKRQEVQRQGYASQRDVFRSLLRDNVHATERGIAINSLNDSAAAALCKAVGLSGGGPSLLRRRRLYKYLGKLAEDDSYLLKEDKGSLLTESELEEALWERGFIADRYSVHEQRKHLRRWLEGVTSSQAGTAPDAIRLLHITKLAATERSTER